MLLPLPLLICHKNQNLQMHHTHKEKQRKLETQK
jgi:hypothetical protein